jgi:hypothetical protein
MFNTRKVQSCQHWRLLYGSRQIIIMHFPLMMVPKTSSMVVGFQLRFENVINRFEEIQEGRMERISFWYLNLRGKYVTTTTTKKTKKIYIARPNVVVEWLTFPLYRRCRVQISARGPAVMSLSLFTSVPPDLIPGQCLKLGHDRFFPNPLKLFLHLSFHSTLYNLSY